MISLALLAVVAAGNPFSGSIDLPRTSPLVALAGPFFGAAGTPGPDEDDAGDDLADALYEPDFIVDHQKDIGLDDKQRNSIIDAIANAQGDLVRSRWKLQAAASDLRTLLTADKIDESKALAKADEVMNLERDVKRSKLSMLIRIKNQLTADQRKKLDDLRDEGFPFAPGSHRRFMDKLQKQILIEKQRAGDHDDAPTPPVPPVPPRP